VRTIPIDLPDGTDERAIESVCTAAGLCVSMRGTLKTCPGCVHWHFKNTNEPGTLEATFWPAQRQAWFSVQDGRTADWIDELLPTLVRRIRDPSA
jgi:hypothetical protein